MITWLTGIWQQSANNKNGVGMLYSLDQNENIETRGNNDEQVAVYDALYERHNMMAIITNKSGAPICHRCLEFRRSLCQKWIHLNSIADIDSDLCL